MGGTALINRLLIGINDLATAMNRWPTNILCELEDMHQATVSYPSRNALSVRRNSILEWPDERLDGPVARGARPTGRG
jgi:hypothetical protein